MSGIKEEFCIQSDNSGHRYIVPVARLDEWEEWMEIPDDDERGWDVPDYAVRIDGGNVFFKEWRIG